MKLIDIIEKISEYSELKLYVDGDYKGTFKTKGDLTYKYLKLEVLSLYVVCDDKQGYMGIDLKR